MSVSPSSILVACDKLLRPGLLAAGEAVPGVGPEQGAGPRVRCAVHMEAQHLLQEQAVERHVPKQSCDPGTGSTAPAWG